MKILKVDYRSTLKVGDRIGDKIVALNGNERVLLKFPKRYF